MLQQDSQQFSDQTYFITGASSGIGFAVCNVLLDKGYRVIGLSRTKPKFESSSFYWLQHDLECFNVEEVVSYLQSTACNGISAAFLNAGVFNKYDIETLDLSLMRKIFQINFFANVELCKVIYPLLCRCSPATVIFNSSDQATKYKSGGLAYGASKAALTSLARGLAVEWAPHGVNVITLMPGGVDTELYNATKTGLTESEIIKSQQKYPIGRVATPEEVASVAVYHMLESNPAITGAEIRIDGGLGCL